MMAPKMWSKQYTENAHKISVNTESGKVSASHQTEINLIADYGPISRYFTDERCNDVRTFVFNSVWNQPLCLLYLIQKRKRESSQM